MPQFYVSVRNVTAHATIEAESREDAERIAIEEGRADWNYDFGSTDPSDVEIDEA